MRVSGLLTGFMFMAQVILIAILIANPPLETEPPLDMLEFLGTWQALDGHDVNPFELNDTEYVPPGDFHPRKPSADSRQKTMSQNKTGSKPSQPSQPQDRLPEGPNR